MTTARRSGWCAAPVCLVVAALVTTVLAVTGIVAPAAQAATLGPITTSAASVIEGSDYASTAFGDPWDMSNPEDLSPIPLSDVEAQRLSFNHGTASGYGIDNASVAGGQFVADVERGGWLNLAETFGTGALSLGRDTAVAPISAARYSHLTVRMFAGAATSGLIMWFGTSCGPECQGASPFTVKPGWNTYDFALGSVTNIATQPWTGLIHNLRIYPNANGPATVHTGIDWMRLSSPGPSVTATVPAAADTVWLDTDNDITNNGSTTLPAAGAEPLATNVRAGQQLTVPLGLRPSGTYYLEYSAGANASTPTPVVVDAQPEPQILSPSLAGGDDWATTVRHDPWDFQQASDVASVDNASVTIGGGQLNGTNAGPRPNDPSFYLAVPTPIDATTYHRLTVKVHYDGPFSLGDESGGGMVARLIWTLPLQTTGQNNQISNDIVVYPGDNTISVDLRTNPPGAINDDSVALPDRLGWGGPQSPNVYGVRFDPNEDPGPRTWRVTSVSLTAEDRGRPDFDVQFRDNAFKAGTTTDLYADTSGTGTGGVKIASGLATAAGINHFDWRGTDVNGSPLGAGAFHIYAVMHDRAGATGTSGDSSVLNMPAQPSAIFGSLEVPQRQPDGVHVNGWAIDPRAGAADPPVALVVDGAPAGTFPTTVPRPDVNAAFPSSPGNHGFSTTIALGAGNHTICATASGPSTPTASFGCQTVTVSSTPVGSLDVTGRGPGGVHVGGWALDPDTAAPTRSPSTWTGPAWSSRPTPTGPTSPAPSPATAPTTATTPPSPSPTPATTRCAPTASTPPAAPAPTARSAAGPSPRPAPPSGPSTARRPPPAACT